MKRYATHIDDRNYKKEALDMIKPLHEEELYKLYKIVIDQQQKRNSAERDKELAAVRGVIEQRRGIDSSRLHSMRTGYRSSMAHDAGLGDMIANNNPKRKKV